MPNCPTCGAPTKAGGKCKNRTCKYAPRCHLHTSVKVGTSNIPNAGRGLFAKQRIRKGQVIADYTLGTERLTAAQFTSRYPSKRATHVWTPDGKVFTVGTRNQQIVW